MQACPSSRPLYRIWSGMMNRCHNQNSRDFHRYGGRGIYVCDRWHTFSIFETWALKNGFRTGLEIERKNNNKGYNPKNCMFANDIQQARNRRNNTHITAFGETKTLVEWSEDSRCTVSAAGLGARLRRNMNAEAAITTLEQHPNSAKTVCKNGHPFTEENTYRYKNSRKCRICKRAREHKH